MQATEYTHKIKQLLQSSDQANVTLAFQLMQGQGIPEALYGLMADSFYKKTLCVQHGIMPPIQDLTNFHLEGDHTQPLCYLFEGFPKALLQLPYLQALTFSQHNFATLPAIDTAWGTLEQLNLAANGLIDLPEDFGNLTKLQQLSLADNELRCLPDSFKKCKQLTELDLSGNQLSDFPAVIGRLGKLEKLNLANNQLSDIPATIGKLKRLKELNLSGNELTDLPAQIGRLKKLETIYLSQNQFAQVPKHLYQAENLVCLEIQDNPMEEEKIEEAQRLFQFKLTVMIFLLGKKF